jgi:hypothetical protein
MLLEDLVIVLAILLFVAAIAIELRRDRDKKMYVGGEAKSKADESRSMPVVRPEAQPPVVTQEELKTPKKSA